MDPLFELYIECYKFSEKNIDEKSYQLDEHELEKEMIRLGWHEKIENKKVIIKIKRKEHHVIRSNLP